MASAWTSLRLTSRILAGLTLAASLLLPMRELLEPDEPVRPRPIQQAVVTQEGPDRLSPLPWLGRALKPDAPPAYSLHWRVVWAAAAFGFLLSAAASVLSFNVLRRIKAERELRRARQILQGVIDSMPSALVRVDGQGAVTQWNREAERLAGLSAERAGGLPAAEALPLFASQLSRLPEVLANGVVMRQEKVCFRSEEGARCFDVMIYPIMDRGDGNAGEGKRTVDGAVIRVDDATARTRMEEVMVQTEKMISVAGLAAGMAHEINTPLSGVAQDAQNILRRISPELKSNRDAAAELGLDLALCHRYLQRRGVVDMTLDILDCAARASRIISGLLTFSRNATGQMAPVELAGLLDRVLELAKGDYDLKKKYDFRHIHIRKEYDSDLPPVLCSETEIVQVVLNIVKNAAQAMAQAGTAAPRLVLRTGRDGDWAVVTVKDNGPGMDEGTRRRIFEPFFTTKEPGHGTGLGLYVSYLIVRDNHGGELLVESAPGQGAAFHVRLPLHVST